MPLLLDAARRVLPAVGYAPEHDSPGKLYAALVRPQVRPPLPRIVVAVLFAS
jgi:hypothetical protein